MKKLLMFMTIVAFAAIAQAASISWYSNGKLVDNKGTALTSLDSGSIVLVLLGTDTEKFTDATVLDTGAINATSKNAGKVTGKYVFEYGKEGSLANDNVLAVIFKDDSGNFSKLRNADDTADQYVEYIISGLGDDTWSRVDYNFSSGNFQAPVPEPTSGLLLLVGASLLALRRKQK